jgi:hypothetical protein
MQHELYRSTEIRFQIMAINTFFNIRVLFSKEIGKYASEIFFI